MKKNTFLSHFLLLYCDCDHSFFYVLIIDIISTLFIIIMIISIFVSVLIIL